MLMQMQRLAVYGDQYFRPYPADEFFKFGAARMSRYVHQMCAVRYDFDPLLDQQIDNPPNRLLVARNLRAE